MLTLLGFGKDFSKEKAGNVSELPQKQGGLDMTIPAHQSTQNKLCIVPKDINKRFFNFHTSLCNSSSSLHTCIWKCSLLKYNAPILGGPAGNLGRPLTTSELANTLKPITLGKAPGLTVSRLIFFFFPNKLAGSYVFFSTSLWRSVLSSPL